MTSAIIVLEGVEKFFGPPKNETRALRGIDLCIAAGEYVAITGPSGGGKSTLLSIIGLLDVPSAGRCFLEGRATHKFGGRERAFVRNTQLGFVFQAFNLIEDLTVFENVELPLVYRGLSGNERRERVNEALDNVGLSLRKSSLPSSLSGGERQRASLARAVAGKPPILLADEPTGNLDSENGRVVMDLIAKLHSNGTTVCLVTHDRKFARLAERRVTLHDGRITKP
jgi:putative ABC transport system ATP-binding protein